MRRPLKDAMEEQREKSWKALLEKEKYNYNVAEEMGKGAVPLVVDRAKAFENVQLKVAWV